jgi:hypothetical protein
MHYHVLDGCPAGERRSLNLAVQPSLILARGGKGGIDLTQIGRDPLLARGESEPRSLA